MIKLGLNTKWSALASRQLERSSRRNTPSMYVYYSHSPLTTSANSAQLFESHAKPCHYMAGAKLTSPGRKASYWRTECHPKRFWEAFRDFTGWFKNITGIEWDDRLDNLPHDPDKFRYTPPKPGRPVGALPPGKLPPSWEESKDNNGDDTDSEVDFEAEVKVEEATSTELGDGYTSTERGDRDSSMERRDKEASVSSISSEAPSSATSVPLEMYSTYPNM